MKRISIILFAVAASVAIRISFSAGAAAQSSSVLPATPSGFSSVHMRLISAYPDGGPGNARILPDEPVVSESTDQHFVIDYEVPSEGVAVGGGIRVSLFDSAGARGADYITGEWTKYQDLDPAAPGFTTASVSRGGAKAELTLVDGMGVPGKLSDFEAIIKISGQPLRFGDHIRLDRLKVKAPILARYYSFPVRVDTKGDGKFREIGAWPGLKVVGQPAKRLYVILPSIVEKGENLDLRIIAIDQHGNPDHTFSGEVGIRGQGVLTRLARFTPANRGAIRLPGAVRFEKAGFFYVRVDGATLSGESNPVRVEDSKPRYRIYWGDTHTHTVFSDGTWTIDEQYEYAKDVAALDFGGASDHDTNFFRKEFTVYWADVLRAAEQHNNPGHFVTIPGYEWSRTLGHRNVFYFDKPDVRGDAPLIDAQNPDQLWAALRTQNHRVLTTPHHVAGAPAAMDWSYHEKEEKMDRLCEVYSVHGSGEYADNPLAPVKFYYGHFLQDGFKQGHKLGMIGSGDWHEAAMGHLMDVPKYKRRTPYSHFRSWGGLAAVYTSELTRDGLYDGMFQRRAYATTNRRIFVDFEMDGHLMGEEYKTSRPPRIIVRVAGTDYLARVDVIRDNLIIYQGGIYIDQGSLSAQDQSWNDDLAFRERVTRKQRRDAIDEVKTADFSLIDNSFAPPPGGSHWYYVRVTQRDGTMAWSSPIWVGRD
jgi:hypothetical protein